MSQYPSEGDFLGSGTVLRGYEIKSVVGRGGFGVVYKGHHRILDSDVAIKEFFPRELARRRSGVVQPMESGCEESFEDGLQRFMAEGRRLEALRDHPNIAICRDLFLANGTSYMVMDFVDGLPLSALLGQRENNGDPFTEEDLLDVILPLLAGLKRVHESGLYHRDIKPSNILIRRQDNQPVLIDFGAAKQESSGATKSMAPYTDGYAAMEQVGEGTIGPWTDIYGVGALMWRMVAGGSPPWEPPSPTKVQHRALAVLQGRTDPLPPASAVGSGRFSPRLLKSIDQCLAISDSSRIRSCDQLLVKIRERTVVAVPPPAATTGRVRKTVSQSRLKQQVRTRRNQFAALRPTTRGLVLLVVLCLVTVAIAMIARGIDDSVPLTVQTVPADAQVELVGHSDTYSAGMALRPGTYRLKVSQPGYESKSVQIKHGAEPTRRQVILSPISPSQPRDSGFVLQPGLGQITQRPNNPLPPRKSFTRGSDMDEVLAVQGTPTGIRTDKAFGVEYWDYGDPVRSSITFDLWTKRVKGWSDSEWSDSSRILKVQMQPRRIVSMLSFTRGSDMDEVLAVQGTPTGIRTDQALREEYWSYGGFFSSRVTFDLRTKRVKGWSDSSGNLKVQMQPRRIVSAHSFTIGSDMDEVLAVQGTPTGISQGYGEEQWGYGNSEVTFDLQTKRVNGWTDYRDILKVQMQPRRIVSAHSFTRGSDMDEVLAVQGTPTGIRTSQSWGDEQWAYGSSRVTFDLRTKRVKGWSDSSGNLKVQMQPRRIVSARSFTRGSDMDEVLAVQGTPTSIWEWTSGGEEYWEYGVSEPFPKEAPGWSTVIFDLRTKRVKNWSDMPGNLKVNY